MDLNHVVVFEAVARTGSFSAAAKALGMPKSSASRAIARLENDLRVQLLFRTTRKVSLSEAGTALYDRVTPLLRSMKGALTGIPERGEVPSGTLKVTAPVDLGVLFLAEVLSRYTARYPGVSVDLHLTGRVVDLVGEGFDVALRVASKLEDSSLIVRRAAPVLFQLFASPIYLARRGRRGARKSWTSMTGSCSAAAPRSCGSPPCGRPRSALRGSSATTSCSCGTP